MLNGAGGLADIAGLIASIAVFMRAHLAGGLADVAGALPKALRRRLIGCRVVMPLYSSIPDELRQKCAKIYQDVYKKVPTEDVVNNILKSCENILLNTGIVEQFDKLPSHCQSANRYKVIMQLLYNSGFDEATLREISSYNIDYKLKNYCRSFLDTIVNAVDDFKPTFIYDFSNKPVAGPSQKMNIVGLSIRDIVKNSSHSIFNTNKWFKLVGTTFAGLVGVTLLTQTGFGKINLNTIQVTGDNK